MGCQSGTGSLSRRPWSVKLAVTGSVLELLLCRLRMASWHQIGTTDAARDWGGRVWEPIS